MEMVGLLHFHTMTTVLILDNCHVWFYGFHSLIPFFFSFFFLGGGAGWKGRAIAMEVNPSPTKCQHSRWNEKQKQRSPDQIKERHSANSDLSTTNLSDNTTNCTSEKRGMKHRHTKPCTHTHTKKHPKVLGTMGINTSNKLKDCEENP